MWSHGNFYWNELNTRDAEAAKNFYGSTLGWIFEPMPMPSGSTYWVAKLGDTPVAGIFSMSGPDFEGVPEAWFSYISVDDVDKRTKKLVAAGGKIIRGPYDIANVGRLVILADNAGARLGFMTPTGDE
jgi:predicted enzyme related to lactoylglutathione lyase